ncbi:DUF3791 domain-containing protein [Aminipila sp.]|uniref:DUF3791 domain-containing protein n=1 Tax=Aminipila sp. TaxID=2060095 RepID=UPI0028A0D850|nr:DUF3791 domain-containing protein [Aminipila sp.]
MNAQLEFKIFCLENYKQANNMKGRETFRLFQKYGVFDYLQKHYDVLHSTGEDYLIKDINQFIQVRS